MKRIKRYLLLILIVAASLLILNYSFTLAKYAANSFWDYYLKSKGFYFTSDDLSANTAHYVNNLWDGGSISFNLKNSLNDSVTTMESIDYEVSCTIQGETSAYTECTLNGTALDTITGTLTTKEGCVNSKGDANDVSLYDEETCVTEGYSYEPLVSINQLYFELATTGNEPLDDVVVNITATSTNPYHKTITGDFTLHKTAILSGNLITKYNHYTNYDKLILTNPSMVDKCQSISWDTADILIGNGSFVDQTIDANDYIEQVKVNIPSKTSRSYIFYKRNALVTPDLPDFTITDASGC